MATENTTPTISINGADIKALAEAASTLTDAAKSIASSMDGVKATVDGFGEAVENMLDGMDEAQESAEYDRQVREDAERMHAEATGGRRQDRSADEVLAEIGDLRTMISNLEASIGDNRPDEKAIIGDTVTAAMDPIGSDISGRMDSAIELFMDIRSQLGSVKSWIESSPQLQAVQSGDTQQDDVDTPSEEPLSDTGALDAISEQYAELNGVLGELGNELRNYVSADSTKEVNVTQIQVPAIAHEEISETPTDDGNGESDNSDMATLVDEMHSLGETVSGSMSPIGGVSASIDGIARTMDDISGKLDRTETVDFREVVDHDREMIERVSETVVGDIPQIDVPQIREIVDDRETPDYRVNFDDLVNVFKEGNSNIYDSMSSMGDAVKGIREYLDDFAAPAATSLIDIADSVDTEPIRNEYDSASGAGQLQRMDSTQSLGNSIGSDMTEAGTVAAVHDDMTDTADVTGQIDSGVNMADTRQDSGNSPEALPTDIVNMMDVVNVTREAERGYKFDAGIPKAPSEPDRYGDSAESMKAVEGNSVKETKVIHEVEKTAAADPAEMERATAAGVLNALLDERFKEVINNGIADIVRATMKGIVG